MRPSEASVPEAEQDAGNPLSQVMPCGALGVMALFDLGDRPMECGTLPHTATVEEQTTAKTCMDTAVADQRPFRLTFTTKGVDAYLTTTLFGASAQATYAVHVIYDGPGQWDLTQWGECTAPPAAGCDGSLETCARCDIATVCSCTPRENDAVGFECTARE